MKRTASFRILAALLLLGVLAALPALGGCKKDGETPDVPIAGADASSEPQVGDNEDAAEPASDGSIAEPDPNAPTSLTVRLYWVEAGENALGVERTIPYTPAVATASMNELLAGPTPQEVATWPAISSAIPSGTKLLGVTVAGGVAKVDLSKEFESGGGTFSVTARLAQVVYTLEQFPTVDAVEFYIEGVRVEMFSGEGLLLDGPQTLDDYDQLLPIDA
jgi:spore germination protein GerM